MWSKIYFIIVSLFLFVTFPFMQLHDVPVVANDESDDIASEIHGIIQNNATLDGSIVGISVRSATSGELIYHHNGDIRLRPASNLKLFTAAASLSSLGEDYKFVTEIHTNGKQKGKTIDGNVYLVGKGDPTLVKKDLQHLVKKLKNSGVDVIKGDVIGDDTWFDDVRYSQDLPWTDEHTYYGGQISALTLSPDEDYDAGTVIIDIKPGNKMGETAKISITPKTNYVKVVNKTKTISESKQRDITVTREHGTNVVTVEGEIPLGDQLYREWISVWDPTKYTTSLFKRLLEQNGIIVKGEAKVGNKPSKSKMLMQHSSMPLSELLIPFMKLSNNGHGEVLVKELGKINRGEGSWDKGIEVMEKELAKLGVNTSTLLLRDGSGISHVNLVPANELTKLLYAIQNEKWFPTFFQSLPVAGQMDRKVGGTLRYRFLDFAGNIQAKTGTLSTVSSLSGYVEGKKGKTYTFSILINNILDESKAKKIEETILTILANQ
ncbi:D-alanyl-D-alanine carboxypeptidase/D-alanyl-D-alanine endopeptidase [Salirhabdus salicampi]|uniref:D-alanyl-D-alanine carboxypeptidase/D-alanyl-D-alanine endopeptidase n=1 Tax=Salirhabdus salicampi TaxID=476102 RepID=UPI0020C30C82|nr:D-alanyl-D-alanine carboxypeptidase/D-alanyl-D-alanine-endopeptidase [Salirhabdus salicampi]MCP8616210.1 D-alanyl-D-alanine carboxypeptidase/D-alanyl-D-alanine-endopeptidase [Salirhabdus salicampi]